MSRHGDPQNGQASVLWEACQKEAIASYCESMAKVEEAVRLSAVQDQVTVHNAITPMRGGRKKDPEVGGIVSTALPLQAPPPPPPTGPMSVLDCGAGRGAASSAVEPVGMLPLADGTPGLFFV